MIAFLHTRYINEIILILTVTKQYMFKVISQFCHYWFYSQPVTLNLKRLSSVIKDKATLVSASNKYLLQNNFKLVNVVLICKDCMHNQMHNSILSVSHQKPTYGIMSQDQT